METISQRQLRNQSGDVLRRVAAGESFVIANGGVPTAVLTPVRPSVHEQLVASGQLTPARLPRSFTASRLRRQSSSAETTEQLLATDRGER